jgi:hypothetical protein
MGIASTILIVLTISLNIPGCVPGLRATARVDPEIGKVLGPATMPARVDGAVQGVGMGFAVSSINSQWPMVAMIVALAAMWAWEHRRHQATRGELSRATQNKMRNLMMNVS